MEKRSLRQRIGRALGSMIVSYHRMRGCDIGSNCHISKSAIIDRVYPKGIHIGNNTRVLIEAMILSHDFERAQMEGFPMRCDTYIGNNCVVGGRTMIMPGVHIGNHVYIAGGAIVTRSVPDHCIVAGNPARIVRKGTIISDGGQILERGERV